MSDIKIIFFDIDGTLLDPDTGCISPKHAQLLHKLEARGIKRCIVTGRPTVGLPDLSGLPLDAIATFNGCFCQAGDQVIYSNPIDPGDVEIILGNAAALGRPVSIALKDRMAANGIDQDLYDYYQHASALLTVADDFEEARKEDIYQIMLGSRESEHAAILENTKQVKLAISWDRAVDVIPLTGGKGSTVQSVLDHFHLDPSEAMAFGDSLNDVEMLQAVGTAVAMGNAVPQLKALAHDVCGPVSEDGIYHYCVAHGLID